MTSATLTHEPYEIKKVINEFLIPENTVKTRGKKPNIEYFNVPCAFDIETTSTIVNEQKQAFMYCWQMALNGAVIFGRDWDEFIYCLETLQRELNLSKEKRLIIYIQNLSFEFQFIRKLIKWESIFSLEEREPVKALSVYGIEFRCSYLLSGYSLEKIGDNLLKYKVSKMVGDLDYSLIRNSKTTLSNEEMKYCINDVLVVSAYIQEKIEQDGSIINIPLTKTGYVRKLCQKACLPTTKEKRKERHFYRNMIKNLTIEPDEYQQLKRAFQGGFTHANAHYVGKVVENVGSFDFTSSYPASMLSERYPMSKGKIVEIDSVKTFNNYIDNWCCLFDIEITNVYAKNFNENYLSFSKCWGVKNYVLNNGRIVSADVIKTTMTEQDYIIFINFYSFKSFKVRNFRVYQSGYLPKPIIETILKLYEDKTQLKNVEGKEVEYLSSKEQVNSTYGMIVTDICRDDILYNETDEWERSAVNLEEAIEKYNNSLNRFLFYPWGVWVTAYSRRNLFKGIVEFDNDYIYADTDSIKAINIERHLDFINQYNIDIVNKINDCLKWHDIDINRSRPKTIEGVEKQLGVWDFEGTYQKFKTLGAKRYMILKDDKYNITVSGLNKKVCVPYILKESKERNINPFEFFVEGMFIPAGSTGKNTHTYIDTPCDGMVIDYQGNIAEYHEKSSIHISACEYKMSLASEFIDYLKGINTIYDR